MINNLTEKRKGLKIMRNTTPKRGAPSGSEYLSDRDWSSRQRTGWWLKYIGTLAAALISIATAAKMLGFTWNIQTKEEASAQYQKLDESFDKKLSSLETKIDNKFDRFDVKMNVIRDYLAFGRNRINLTKRENNDKQN